MSITRALFSLVAVSAAVSAEPLKKKWDQTPLTDLSVISRSWGQISTYADNPENYFGVQDIGLPAGCGIEQAHTLQRHGQRFPTSSYDDGLNDERFAGKLQNWTTANATKVFSGPLA